MPFPTLPDTTAGNSGSVTLPFVRTVASRTAPGRGSTRATGPLNVTTPRPSSAVSFSVPRNEAARRSA